mmetsp:Transcript_7797/g.22332  ORF Transcript_7797/g.22332 Transcript_7797/m.22332 type:complete len:295 (+) Transcript_7797:954-1838(+)
MDAPEASHALAEWVFVPPAAAVLFLAEASGRAEWHWMKWPIPPAMKRQAHAALAIVAPNLQWSAGVCLGQPHAVVFVDRRPTASVSAGLRRKLRAFLPAIDECPESATIPTSQLRFYSMPLAQIHGLRPLRPQVLPPDQPTRHRPLHVATAQIGFPSRLASLAEFGIPPHIADSDRGPRASVPEAQRLIPRNVVVLFPGDIQNAHARKWQPRTQISHGCKPPVSGDWLLPNPWIGSIAPPVGQPIPEGRCSRGRGDPLKIGFQSPPCAPTTVALSHARRANHGEQHSSVPIGCQ